MKLTSKEKELIVSCLLHVASPDISIGLGDDETRELVKIAKKFGVKKVSHAYIFGLPNSYFDELGITEMVSEEFNIDKTN